MPRYLIELAYQGTNYAGFQIQQNANSVQAEVEKALKIYYRNNFSLTGSSRTDAGVHALQNFFHFDADETITDGSYNLNAILPADIVIKKILPVSSNFHCRFSALSREYQYRIYQHKNPFLHHTAYFFPYKLDIIALKEAASVIMQQNDFETFCKRNTQTKTTICKIFKSQWDTNAEGSLIYTVKGNRFLRGMVRGMVGTMLKVGTGKLTLDKFISIIHSKDCTKADFSAPPEGLFLNKVEFP